MYYIGKFIIFKSPAKAGQKVPENINERALLSRQITFNKNSGCSACVQ